MKFIFNDDIPYDDERKTTKPNRSVLRAKN